MVKIKFLARFKEITGAKFIELNYTGNLSGLIDLLIKNYGSTFKKALLNENGEFRDYIKILINGEDVNTINLPENIDQEDEIVIFQTIAGG